MANPDSFLADNDALIAYNKHSRDKGKQTKAPTLDTKLEPNMATTLETTFSQVSYSDGGRLTGNVNQTSRDFSDSTS